MSPSKKQVAQDVKALFDGDDDDGENMRDKVRAVFEHFDKDEDGFLNFAELAALQKVTEGVTLSEEMFMMACKALDCRPHSGISLDALKLTYAAQGSDISKDYLKVFPEKKKKESDDDDIIYEVGDDGAIDISS